MASGRPPGSGAGGRVRRLPDTLVDQIAAGEVVERPASVVKELVENALDAGARRVRVEVRDGGRAFVSVTDDGSGMTPEDARAALERHATSKLRDASDLAAIATYGFRGEALPAIASVSSLRLLTRPHEAREGTEIRVRAGALESVQPAGAAAGTRIEVADLFASVPARRKFLKSAVTEWGHIADWLSRAALALPEVHFDLARDDRPGIAWPAAAPLDRLAAVLGESEAAGLVALDHRAGALRVHGFTSRPDHHRATAAGIQIFVQGRPVRDRVVQHALQELYRDVLPRGRHPTAVLFLELPPGAVDVNVHPAKWEVRFADPRGVHQLVRHALQAALARRSWLGAAARDESVGDSEPRVSIETEGVATGRRVTDWIFATPERARPHAEGDTSSAARTAAAPFRLGDCPLLGQLAATYLLLEGKDELLLVDQHAAHERVLYERLRASVLAEGAARQALLVPLVVELAPRPLAALANQSALAESLGFETAPFGESAVALRAVPALLAERDPAGLLRTLAEELATAPASEAASALRALGPADRVLATLACHASRRKGDLLDPREQHALLEALDAIPWAPTCPHGRPVVVPVSLAEIERRFGRR
ncbi:MAG TPA: DNA mismatch repair endonuclease MutL [Myxococcota bacterium]|nr:DNA mismatch repair endonuclease MutL [Myxococcota bacterium]